MPKFICPFLLFLFFSSVYAADYHQLLSRCKPGVYHFTVTAAGNIFKEVAIISGYKHHRCEVEIIAEINNQYFRTQCAYTRKMLSWFGSLRVLSAQKMLEMSAACRTEI